ncbi:uncharacterized protein LOC108907863 [Anoplophora glabripennis]|uniref:uncharacterized protein LOC108907863 n=1 Tax=Anoplophora glabripennis TaxID=217634 RepID=UPI000C77771D|nr:uncharacterized protein LOC108907863 [Anoplophora glabripennis]
MLKTLLGFFANMAGDVDVESESLDKKCKICNETISRGGVKCSTAKCNVLLHSKCFDLVAKVVFIEKKTWKCRTCSENLRGQCSNSSTEVTLLQKENECLIREAEMSNKRISDLEYIVNLQKSLVDAIKCKEITPSGDNEKARSSSSYSDQLRKTVNKSSVLVIKSNDKSIDNKRIEKDVKSAINPGSININVKNTKLIRNGILINCEDKNSCDKLKNSLENTIGFNYDINEPKKRNPRISVHNIKAGDLESALTILQI